MDGVPEAFDSPEDAVDYRRPAHRAGIELYRAHIVHHSFEPHAHEGLGLGAIESGAERFRYRGSEHLAAAGSLVLMNADELHTGRAETAGGWRYRMVYIEPAVLEAVTGDRGWHFRQAVGHDAPRARRVHALLRQLWQQADAPLAFDSLLFTLLAELRVHAQVARGAPGEGALRFVPVLEHLRAHLHEKLTLEQLAAVAGLSPFHFLRRFQAVYHATPQQMLMALRLLEAKRLLAAGDSPAAAAAAVGLADQAHLTRAFARRYGVTPGRYQRQLRVSTPRRR
ncbi:MAG: AraC family transcriptional regulator [Rubrivivax sp.]